MGLIEQQQVYEFLNVLRFGQAAIQAGVLFYEKTVDKANYVKVALPALSYQEEIDDVKKQLGL